MSRSYMWVFAGAAFAGLGVVAHCNYQAHAQQVATTDQQEVCGKVDGMSYSKRHRTLLPYAEKRMDFTRYGVAYSEHKKYELDHIVPLCLGGADTPQNRRPQPCDEWKGRLCVAGEAAVKDRLENYVCRQVCHGDMPLATGQSMFMTDWKASYRQVFGEEP